MSLVMYFIVHAQVTEKPVLSLERLLVEPRPEDGQRRRVLRLRLVPPQRAVLVAQWIRRQHDGQLQLDRFLQVARRHDELQSEGEFIELIQWRTTLFIYVWYTWRNDRPTSSANHKRLMTAVDPP